MHWRGWCCEEAKKCKMYKHVVFKMVPVVFDRCRNLMLHVSWSYSTTAVCEGPTKHNRILKGGWCFRSLRFPNLPYESLGLRVPQLPPPLEHPPVKNLTKTSKTHDFWQIKLNNNNIKKQRCCLQQSISSVNPPEANMNELYVKLMPPGTDHRCRLVCLALRSESSWSSRWCGQKAICRGEGGRSSGGSKTSRTQSVYCLDIRNHSLK